MKLKKIKAWILHCVIKVQRAVCRHKIIRYRESTNDWKCLICGKESDKQTDF